MKRDEEMCRLKEVIRCFEKLHEKLHNFSFLPNIISEVMARSMRLAINIERMEKRSAQKILAETLQRRKRPLGIFRHRLGDNVS
jgi:hypothetical protein